MPFSSNDDQIKKTTRKERKGSLAKLNPKDSRAQKFIKAKGSKVQDETLNIYLGKGRYTSFKVADLLKKLAPFLNEERLVCEA